MMTVNWSDICVCF